MATDIQAIKDKIDIVELIGEYVELRPAGVNHKGRCPFHQEKTPSFMVHRERQFWHCFGCQKGGDIFTFMQEMEGMDFPEALRFLGQKAGIPLETIRTDATSSVRTRLKEINAEAARFFHLFLLQMDPAKPAREYLARRGLLPETIEEWRIGYAADQWELLTKYLLKKGFGIDDLVVSGLTIKRDGANASTGRGFYDRFRGRIMFPICDVHGSVVGFTGRILVETTESGGKYINTPQTPLYDKSRVVFGLDKAKQEIKAKNRIIMAEGQMDVIACHQAGMKNVVAASGTAMTDEQVKLLKRYSDNISMAFDADAAGQAAADRGVDVALSAGMNIKVISIPEGAGKDADECLKKDPAVWFRAVEDARPYLAYFFEKTFRGKTFGDPRHKQQIADAILPKIARIPYAVERDHWLRLLGERLGVEAEVLREDLERVKKDKRNNEQGTMNKEQTTSVSEKRPRLDMLLERLFALFFHFPQLIIEHWKLIIPAALSTSSYAALYELLKARYTVGTVIQLSDLREHADSDNLRRTIDILQLEGEKDFSDFTADEGKKEAGLLIRYIREEWIRMERQRLQAAIAEAERGGEKEKVSTLLIELQELAQQK